MATEIIKTDAEWQEELTPEQYQVLRQAGTERAFTGRYWDCHDDGVYRCAGCGAELFDAGTKFESGSGWPSFTEPKLAEDVEVREDNATACAARRSSASAAAATSATCSTTARATRAGCATASTPARSTSSGASDPNACPFGPGGGGRGPVGSRHARPRAG